MIIEYSVVGFTYKTIWIGGYQMYFDNTHYWLDGEPVDVAGLTWAPGNPHLNDDTHLVLYKCQQWDVTDYDRQDQDLHVLCEI